LKSFHLSIFILISFLTYAFFLPETFQVYSSLSLSFIISKFGWFYLLVTFSVFVYCVYLTLSKYGNIKLGEDSDPVQYNFKSWLAMLFSAGMGIGLVFYGISEPLAHFLDPPLGLAEPKTPQAAFLSLRYTFFHWGVHPWAIYALLGMSMAYFQFRKKDKSLISTLFKPLGLKSESLFAKFIDAISICGVAFGVATSLGLGSLQIHSGLTRLFDIPTGMSVTLTIVSVTTVLYLISACTGLDKGIRILSNLNMVLAGLLVMFVLFTGPTNFLVELLFTAIGNYLQNFISMSFRMAPFTDSGWLQNWTLFYWAWWISWAPFVATFIARISKGRTIREFMIGVLLLPTVLSMVWFSVLGGTGIFTELYQDLNISSLISQDPSAILFITLEKLPLGYWISIIAIALVMVFFITSADSATFVLGMLSSDGNANPSLISKLIWGTMISLVASGLLINGGLKSLQSLAIITSLPFAILIFVLIFSIHKSLRMDEKFINKKEKL